MMSNVRWAALPLALQLCSSAAFAQDRCLAAQYTPPPSIDVEMRPYLVCGMFSGDGHPAILINGVSASLQGGGVEACRTIRSLAFEAADRRLTSNMPNPAERRTFLTVEFDRADRFLAVAARSDDLTIGEAPSAPQCRNPNASN